VPASSPSLSRRSLLHLAGAAVALPLVPAARAVKDLADGTNRDSQVEVGRGILPIVGVFKELVRTKFQGHVSLEYEIKADDPVPGMLESLSYMRGIAAALA